MVTNWYYLEKCYKTARPNTVTPRTNGNNCRTMGCKGQATSAVYRSSIFQIYFLGFSKLVAVNLLAPKPGRSEKNNHCIISDDGLKSYQ